MSMRDLTRRIKYLLHREEFANDLDEEMRLHLELRASRLRERGMNAEEARLAARRQFGNRAAVEIASSEAWGWTVWERLWQDVRQAVRALRKTPGFSIVALLTIAVGIGANTALFSVYDRLVLRPVTIPDPDSLVAVWTRNPQLNFNAPAVFTIVATLACLVPSWRASRIDPLIALRTD